MAGNGFRKALALSTVGLTLAAALSACGSLMVQTTSGNSSATVTATATCTPVANTMTRVSGTVKSATSSTLVVTEQHGSSVTAALASSTGITQQVQETKDALSNGKTVTVTVTQSSDGSTYTADTIQLVSSTGTGAGGFGGFGGSRNGGSGTPPAFGGQGNGSGRIPCGFSRGSGSGGGFGGGNGSGGAGGNTGNRLTGTIAQLVGNTLTVTDSSNNDYALVITSSTHIIETQKASASALKAGQYVSLTGTTENGKVTARSVAITLTAATDSSSNSNTSNSGV